MTLKVEIVKIPNSNNNKVSLYNETTLNGKSNQKISRSFIVPQENTDEFVTKIKKSEKNKLITVGLSALAGIGAALGLGIKYLNKNLQLDYTILGFVIIAAGVLPGSIPSYIINTKEKNLFKKLNVNEIK